MSTLSLSRVCFGHTDAVALIRDLTLRLEPGWTGVVGANGAGKTTLLQLLAGELVPETGHVRRSPTGLRVCLCPQTVEALGADVRLLAADDGGAAARLRGQLALDAADLERWPSLSPGERKRWQVGAALHAEPGALLLDEPTNHLDVAARDRLAAALAAFRGIGVLVSHDRALLDALSDRTLRFHGGAVRLWRGGYSAARGAWEQEEREQLDAWRDVQSERRAARRRLADTRRRRDRAEARRRREMRRAPIADIDTRKRQSMSRRRSAEARLGREIRKLHGTLERLDGRAAGFDLHKERGRALFVDWEPPRTRRLLAVDEPELRAGERVVLRDVRVELDREGRVHVAGPNGSGKTTLVEALVRSAHIPAERILYLPQELPAGAGAGLLAALRRTRSEQRGHALSIVAALGIDPDALLASAQPSPGEARKLALALGLARRVWALLLDEPTNHLDLPSIERFEEALAAYPGALVVVTHDEAFAERITDERWTLRDGAVAVRGSAP